VLKVLWILVLLKPGRGPGTLSPLLGQSVVGAHLLPATNTIPWLVKSLLFLIFAFVFVQTSLVELGWNRENKSQESLGSWVLGKSTSETDPS